MSAIIIPLAKQSAFDRWLEERILCGYSMPITRRQAIQNMVEQSSMTHNEAVGACCLYREIP